jgi:hypothetical protein
MTNIDNIFDAINIDTFSFPFNKDSITGISMWSSNWSDFIWHSKIEFKNGNTQGTQNFENKDFELLIKEMKQFMKKLN